MACKKAFCFVGPSQTCWCFLRNLNVWGTDIKQGPEWTKVYTHGQKNVPKLKERLYILGLALFLPRSVNSSTMPPMTWLGKHIKGRAWCYLQCKFKMWSGNFFTSKSEPQIKANELSFILFFTIRLLQVFYIPKEYSCLQWHGFGSLEPSDKTLNTKPFIQSQKISSGSLQRGSPPIHRRWASLQTK